MSESKTDDSVPFNKIMVRKTSCIHVVLKKGGTILAVFMIETSALVLVFECKIIILPR